MTTAELPAWSEPFHGNGPGAAPTLGLDGPVTREWAFGDRSGRGVRVAIIDSGIDAEHPAVGSVACYAAIAVDQDGLVSVNASTAIAVDQDGLVSVNESPHTDLYGHGTACAAIVRELAPGAELISVRVLGDNLRGSTVAFARGIEWCIDNGIAVANLSLSTTNTRHAELFHELIDRAAFSGLMLVSAMNNERTRTIPSEFAGVFSVACAPGSDRERYLFNPNGPAEWGAPGLDVDVAWMAGATITATGNSFAAPVLAGHLARLVAAHPGITPWQARTVLAELADNASRRPDGVSAGGGRHGVPKRAGQAR